MKLSSYRDVRGSIQPGDVIAFGGKGRASSWIKFLTRGPVSHVGIVLRRKMANANGDPRVFVEVIESTSLGGVVGVQTTRLSDHLRSYEGEIWWLPLEAEVRARMDEVALFDFLFAQDGKAYDLSGSLRAGFDLFDSVGFEADEDFARFFCSELVAAGLEAAGAVGSVNASEVTPIELCRWCVFADAHQVAGESLVEIEGFNSRAPR